MLSQERNSFYNLSLFGYNSGIFHQGTSIFKSKINLFGSIIVLFFSLPFIIFKILSLGREIGMSTYFKKVNANNLENIEFIKPPVWEGEQQDIYDVKGIFPLAVFARHITCEEI